MRTTRTSDSIAMGKPQYVILSSEPSNADGSMAAIAPRADILRTLQAWNTWPEREGEDVLYGPGVRIEMTPGQDPVTQMLLTIDDEDIGWITIMRMASKLGWKLLDPTSGRELSPR